MPGALRAPFLNHLSYWSFEIYWVHRVHPTLILSLQINWNRNPGEVYAAPDLDDITILLP